MKLQEQRTQRVLATSKEDVANKSTDVTTDGSSDTKYPSVKSVKDYVDASSTGSSTALANEVTRATNAENTLTTNLNTEVTDRTNGDATITTNLNNEVTRPQTLKTFYQPTKKMLPTKAQTSQPMVHLIQNTQV